MSIIDSSGRGYNNQQYRQIVNARRRLARKTPSNESKRMKGNTKVLSVTHKLENGATLSVDFLEASLPSECSISGGVSECDHV